MEKALFHHLALPERLPQTEDPNLDDLEVDLVGRLVDTLCQIQGTSAGLPGAPGAWDSARALVESSATINHRGKVNAAQLVCELKSLAGRSGASLLVHVRSQNAAVLLHRVSGDRPEVLVEAFEASPKNEDVLAADNALVWDFPGSAVAVPLDTFCDDDFQLDTAKFLEQASLESSSSELVSKAGVEVKEYRDTANPRLITSTFMATLAEIGRPVSTPVLQKRVRDDVCWRSGKPWRRLPFWLVLRVAMARHLMLTQGNGLGRFLYKVFVSVFLAEFMESSRHILSLEQLDFLKTKLCRRLAKLDMDKAATQAYDDNVELLYHRLTTRIETIVEITLKYIHTQWEACRATLIKTIPPLPRRASSEDTNLELRISGRHLRQYQQFLRNLITGRREAWIPPADFNPNTVSTIDRQISKFVRPIQQVVKLEKAVENLPDKPPRSQLAQQIKLFVQWGLPACKGNVEQMSLLILNTMELWIKLDQQMCQVYPLLEQFHPVFTPRILNPLRLSLYKDMVRLQDIQRYLHERIKACSTSESRHATIFDDPSDDCFGRRYYDEDVRAADMHELYQRIQAEAEYQLESKKAEWRDKSDTYEALARQVDRGTCSNVTNENNRFGESYHISAHCPRCQAHSEMKSLRIDVYEDALPSELFAAKTAIFELLCPTDIVEYRETTWVILTELASPDSRVGNEKVPAKTKSSRTPISQDEQLSRFVNPTFKLLPKRALALVSLAKPFLRTHYRALEFPVSWDGDEGIHRPNGFGKLAYYDTERNERVGWNNQLRPQFSHHLQLRLPRDSAFRPLLDHPSFAAESEGPSSYEVMATQSNCPAGLSPHEFLAFKTLLSGHSRRWVTLLVELGSANLNWSSEASMMLLNHIALQCGPESEHGDPYRRIHTTFRDVHFVDRLLAQVESRLSTLAALASWRETHLMGVMITLSLRILDFGQAAEWTEDLRSRAQSATLRCRHICVTWFRLLREEIRKCSNINAAQQLQQRALATALLCRRTFACHLGDSTLDAAALEAYIESTIVIHENMVGDIASLPETIAHDFVSGFKLGIRLLPLVLGSITAHGEAFGNALMHFWPQAERLKSTGSTMTPQQDAWVHCDIPETQDECHQTVHFNALYGTLLVNGKPVGKLPKDPQNSTMITELFGTQPLSVYQSSIPGMSYTLTIRPRHGFIVHVGYIQGPSGTRQQIIVAEQPHSGVRVCLVDRTIFTQGSTSDLPGPLVDNMFHWLNLANGQVYITAAANPWSMRNAWTLDVNRPSCYRICFDGSRDFVVDVHSRLFRRIANILDGLTPKEHILVMQSSKQKNLSVQVQKMNLYFFVNHNKLLYSPQLGLEVDTDQDIGTWYGLMQKLVCRKVNNRLHRIVLVPLGDLTAERYQCHVKVWRSTDHTDMYGKFVVNSTLGRIDCAAEPGLIYYKALLHAYTSCIVPDPLTGRTGAEESLEWLRSGICRPWTALESNSLPVRTLLNIASLTPIRGYHPPHLKVLKTEAWDPKITTHIQNPCYRAVVEEILTVSENLKTVSTNAATGQASRGTADNSATLHPEDAPTLALRASVRRRLFERRSTNEDVINDTINRPYQSRDKLSSSDPRVRRVLEVTKMLRTKPDSFATPTNLAAALAEGNVIGGYGQKYSNVSLSNRIRVDLRENWGSLVEYCRQSPSPYDLMYFFASLCSRDSIDDRLLKGLVAFSVFKELQIMSLPGWPEYFNFQRESAPKAEELRKIIDPFRKPAPERDSDLVRWFKPNDLRRLREEKMAHEKRSDDDCRFLVKQFLSQWPCDEPRLPLSCTLREGFLVDVPGAADAIKPMWLRLYQNKHLADHLMDVQKVLDKHRSTKAAVPLSLGTLQLQIPSAQTDAVPGNLAPPRVGPDGGVPQRRPPRAEVPRLGPDLLPDCFSTRRMANLGSMASPVLYQPSKWAPFASLPSGDRRPYMDRNATPGYSKPNISQYQVKKHIGELRSLVEGLGNSKSLVRRDYARDLLRSIDAFASLRTTQQLASPFMQIRDCTATRAAIQRTFSDIERHLSLPNSTMSPRRVRWLQLGGLWPAVTMVTLLETLRSRANLDLGRETLRTVINLGLAVTRLQRETRLNDCALASDASRFQDEEANLGHSNWNPADYPDWLLLEIESNILIRPDQVDVARATISPSSGTNSVLQMNMGQGKTSCIIPMVAAAMADRESLVRIITPKALLLQTAQLLQARLGNLLDRQVRHIPFSRRTETSVDNMSLYFELHKDIQKSAGIMICLPEHNLSFMLSGQQRVLDNKMDEAKKMIENQLWLKTVCRDILDESDYTLAVRTQLIYPSSSQVSVDGHPHRWHMIEAILSLVDQHLHSLEADFPRSIEVVRRPGGGFPLIYFLRRDAEDALLQRLAKDVCSGRLAAILPVRSFSSRQRAAIKDFITPQSGKVSQEAMEKMIEVIRGLRPEKPEMSQCVYLLRGLLVNRILMMTLKKRWNVQYGLRPGSDPVAVPFHAKGVPSETSEWGHPDVAITLTCLTFYYDGVSESQLRQALTKILKSDDPSTEYDKWAQSSPGFPSALRAWNTITVEDAAQVQEIWRAVRYNVVVIDYFLNNFVFPQHAKQFKVKLQSSGWDIPLFAASAADTNGSASNSGKTTRALTTGFSGTNDNRTMLPLTIKQADLPRLSHTNAEVLTYLLHDRSRACEVIRAARGGGRGSELDLLYMLKQKSIKVLIDAGAQILEMDNESLARAWLDVDHSCDAALYFDGSNRPWVIARNGRRTPLLASPYADDLTKCLVYLDEAHTRGTDLKFPLTARAALTVGQGQSKDHTVQAAMRLRQLGSSQSVTFFIPPEVHQVIVDLRGKSYAPMDSRDVIAYLLDNTCDGIEQLQPLFYSQGIDFCRRTQAALDNPGFVDKEDERRRYVSAIKQNESQTLREMYEPKLGKAKGRGFKSSHPQVATFVKELDKRRKGFQDTGKAVHASALQEVEQEREVAFEVETVRQVKKRVKHDALGFPGLHQDLMTLASTGRLPIASAAVTDLFRLLSSTTVGRKHRVASYNAKASLLVSIQFSRSIKLYDGIPPDHFLRPVNWLLWSNLTSVGVVIIPEEAEQIIRHMQAGKAHPDVHLVTYASPITRSMLPFGNLSFFSIPKLPDGWEAPTWLKLELGLLAGRLYFEWKELDALTAFFGVVEEEEMYEGDEEEDVTAERNVVGDALWSPRPLTFLIDWLAVRRVGQDFAHTPMGFLAQGKTLSEDHPFFGGVVDEAPVERAPARVTWGTSEEEYEEDEDAIQEVDDMGANVGGGSDTEGDDVWASAEEDFSEEEE